MKISTNKAKNMVIARDPIRNKLKLIEIEGKDNRASHVIQLPRRENNEPQTPNGRGSDTNQ